MGWQHEMDVLLDMVIVVSIHVIDQIMVLKSGPDRTVRPEKPWTFRFCGFLSFKNRSMWKKQGSVQTLVGPCGSENRDRFLRFERVLSASAFPMNIGYTGMKLWSDLEEMKKKWKNTKKNKNQKEIW